VATGGQSMSDVKATLEALEISPAIRQGSPATHAESLKGGMEMASKNPGGSTKGGKRKFSPASH
jgi:hypothetical protein